MRLAIIGLGSIGTRHLRNALALGCEVFVRDSDPAREHGAMLLGASDLFYGVDTRCLSQPDSKPLYPKIDALMVCTPCDNHLKWVQWAVEHRVHVFCEKPLGTLAQMEDWRALVKASEGLVTQVGYMLRFHPWVMQQKALGPVDTAFLYCLCDMGQWPGSAKDGDPLLECSHEIDLALHLCGGGHVEKARRDDECCWTEMERAFIGIWHQWRSGYSREWAVYRNGEDETIEFNSPEELGDQMYVGELKHFLDCVQSGRQTDVPLSDGLRVLEVCQQVEQMARTAA